MPERGKNRQMGMCMMTYYKTRNTPKVVRDSKYCTGLLLNTSHSTTCCLSGLSCCSGFGQISRWQNVFAAQIKQTWSKLQLFPIISRFIEGNVSKAPLDRNEGQIRAVPHLTDLIWLSIDSDLLLWPEIKVSTVFI